MAKGKDAGVQQRELSKVEAAQGWLIGVPGYPLLCMAHYLPRLLLDPI